MEKYSFWMTRAKSLSRMKQENSFFMDHQYQPLGPCCGLPWLKPRWDYINTLILQFLGRMGLLGQKHIVKHKKIKLCKICETGDDADWRKLWGVMTFLWEDKVSKCDKLEVRLSQPDPCFKYLQCSATSHSELWVRHGGIWH